MSSCYGIAWLFHFKMSPNTTILYRPSGYGMVLHLVPYIVELSFGNASSDAGGRATFLTTSLHQVSSVTPGRFCIPFTDPKPAREMHMRRNHLDGDGRKN